MIGRFQSKEGGKIYPALQKKGSQKNLRLSGPKTATTSHLTLYPGIEILYAFGELPFEKPFAACRSD